MFVSHASVAFGPSVPSKVRKWKLAKSRNVQPMGSARSLGHGICDIASVRCLVASAINCTKVGCIPSLYDGGGGGGGNSSSPFSSGRGS